MKYIVTLISILFFQLLFAQEETFDKSVFEQLVVK